MHQAKIVLGYYVTDMNFKRDAHTVTSSSRSTCTRKIPSISIIGGRILLNLLKKLTCKETVRGGVEQQCALAGSSGALDSKPAMDP